MTEEQPPETLDTTAQALPEANMPPEIRHSTCPLDCPSTCALEIEKLDRFTIGRIRGAPANSYTAGTVCAKVARYAELLPREGVLEVAQSWAAVARRVIVSEQEPLPLDGWKTERLTAKKEEWLTIWPAAAAPPAHQYDLGFAG